MGAANCKSERLVELCPSADVRQGGMKEVTMPESSVTVLLVRDADGVHGVGHKCSHFGAKLVNGALNTLDGRVRCPWHGACFNYRSGDIEDFPGIDSLPSFAVLEKDGKIFLRLADGVEPEANSKRVKPMLTAKPNSDQAPVVIVGAGAAGLSCAETLRQLNFTGTILLLTQEDCAPYDRTKLSKAPNVDIQSIQLRDFHFLSRHNIQMRCKSRVVQLDTQARTVEVEGGEKLVYSSLVIATGGRPRQLRCKGLENFSGSVLNLRTPADGKRIAEDCPGKEVLVVGCSFIGMELAAFLAEKAKCVRVLCRSETPPFSASLGVAVGGRIRALFESKGVEFVVGEVGELSGEGVSLREAVLKDGSRVGAELVLVGIGVESGLDWVPASVDRSSAGGWVVVDGEMRSSEAGVWAVGDVTAFPLALSRSAFPSTPVNVQHWQMALKQGQVAAASIAGEGRPIHSVPFFWTSVFGKSFRFTGLQPPFLVSFCSILSSYFFQGTTRGWVDEQVIGSLEDLKFAVYYLNEYVVFVFFQYRAMVRKWMTGRVWCAECAR